MYLSDAFISILYKSYISSHYYVLCLSGYYIVVYLAGHFLHLINCRQQDLLCYSLFLSGELSYLRHSYFTDTACNVCMCITGLCYLSHRG